MNSGGSCSCIRGRQSFITEKASGEEGDEEEDDEEVERRRTLIVEY